MDKVRWGTAAVVAGVVGLYYYGKRLSDQQADEELWDPNLGMGWSEDWRPQVNFVPTISVTDFLAQREQNTSTIDIIPGSITHECPYGYDPRSSYCYRGPEDQWDPGFTDEKTTRWTAFPTFEPCPVGRSVITRACMPLLGSSEAYLSKFKVCPSGYSHGGDGSFCQSETGEKCSLWGNAGMRECAQLTETCKGGMVPFGDGSACRTPGGTFVCALWGNPEMVLCPR